MSQKRCFQTVIRYQTLDGQTFKTEKEAMDHAENETGVQLQALLREAQAKQKIEIGAKAEFRLCQFIIANAERFNYALRGLVAFDRSDDETTGEEG